MRFEVPGPIVPWQRIIMSRGRMVNPAKYKRYKQHIAACGSAAKQVWQMKSGGKRWPLDARYDLVLGLYFQDLRTRDDDNVEKAVKDGLKGVLWKDDNWCRFGRIVKRMALSRNDPKVVVCVTICEYDVTHIEEEPVT